MDPQVSSPVTEPPRGNRTHWQRMWERLFRLPSDPVELRRQLLVVAFLGTVLLLVMARGWWSPAQAPVLQDRLAQVQPPVKVMVEGAVKNPGLYEVAAGSSVLTVLERAEPTVSLERLSARFGSFPVREGMALQLIAPEEGSPQVALSRVGGSHMGLLFLELDLNTATVEELTALPGIGPKTAEAIVAHRTSNGPFERIEDLEAVPGIGPRTIESLRFRVAIGGQGGHPQPPVSEEAHPSHDSHGELERRP